MKIVWASHSLVAPRQYWFVDYIGLMTEPRILKLAPRDWGEHHVEWGYDVGRAVASPWIFPSGIDFPNMATFTFPDEAIAAVEQFKPDIIYCQQEAYCRVSSQLRRLAGRLGCKFVLFVWENLRSYDTMPEEVRQLLSSCNLVICGSGAAERLVKPYNNHTVHCIQVGVNTVSFCPIEIQKDYDIVFIGRMTPEKGTEVLKKAIEGTSWKVLWPGAQRIPYEQLPRHINRASVHFGHSLDTESWVEQHGNYANYEALASGLKVLTSQSRCIVEALQGCPGVMFDEQGNWKEVRRTLEIMLSGDSSINIEGRNWIERNYGYKKIAEKHLAAFDEVLSR